MTKRQAVELGRLALGFGVAYTIAAASLIRWLKEGWKP